MTPTDLTNKKIGFIGTGKMGEALIKGILHAKLVKPSNIYASDRDSAKLQLMEKENGLTACGDNCDAVEKSDIIIIAVKPNIVPVVLEEIKDSVKNRLVISIAAGVSLETYENALPSGTKVVRVMPNIAATVKEAISSICLGTAVSTEDAGVATSLFNAIGKTVILPEHLMDAVTGLSGSGPAYVFMIIEALADGGVHEGLDRKTSRLLAAQTVLGAAKMVLDNGTHTGDLKDMVTSPGGTTSRGIRVMEQCGVRVAMMNAVIAASERSRELGKKS
ncbi:MAG: pyrroline-5-carboxylate reductase [Candidatus Methanoperedens sp.]|jgi:pyrroline-5-carboxylate reductase|nr:pyrroline-5-carboxylate reductase [Candidatus Methanoperedens sp.]PKL54441.1 MAG: pyrroline-5-carboxylate reductase [Candidatus Methanoperedenaceae archaeon HGW-Methanoperedenaceae-1]